MKWNREHNLYEYMWYLCLISLHGKDMQVVMGDLSLNMIEGTEQTVRVEEAIVHENFRETPTAVYNDIGDPPLSY